MLLIKTDTSKVGVKIRTKNPIKAQQLPKYKLLRSKSTKTKKVSETKKLRLLTRRQFEELRALIELKSAYLVGRSNLLDLLIYEQTILVRVIQKIGNEPYKYIVRIAGMTYLADTEEISISIHDPSPFCLPGRKKHYKAFITNEF